MENNHKHTNTDKSQLSVTSKAFDHKGNMYSSLKRMCNTYNTYPEHYTKEIQSNKTKKQALTGKRDGIDIIKKLSIVLLTLLCILIIFILLQCVKIPLGDSFFSNLASPNTDTITEKASSQAYMGFNKLRVDYSNLVTLNTNNNTATVSIENTSGADIRFSVECKLNTQSGALVPIAKNTTIIKPGEKIDTLTLESGVNLPTEKVEGTFVLTLYEGDSSTPLSQKVDIHSIIVSPGNA